MSYQSVTFLLFSVLVAALYRLPGKRLRCAVLLIANAVFFASAGLKHLPYIAFVLLLSYFSARRIGTIYELEKAQLTGEADKERKKEIRGQSKKKAKRVLLFALIFAVGLLSVTKYTGFAVRTLGKLAGKLFRAELNVPELFLPIGISFYTFMAIGYVLDVYWKRYPAEKNLCDYAAFLTYFPHVVQGPIDRYPAFHEQLTANKPVDWDGDIVPGARRVLWGLFKKLVFADRIGVLVDTVYGNSAAYSGTALFLTTAAYALQLYADFSGCIDIVSGVSEMMGIRLRQNFRQPYFAKTLSEFWRRWHISLMEWFRDYVYLPFSGSRLMRSVKKHFREKGDTKAERFFAVAIPTALVWMLTGLWHGAQWKYVLWGVYYAALMIGSELLSETFSGVSRKLGIRTESRGWRFVQMARTFLITTLGRVIFRADRAADVIRIFRRIFTFAGGTEALIPTCGLSTADLAILALALAFIWYVDIRAEQGVDLRSRVDVHGPVFRWAVTVLFVMIIVIFGVYGPAYSASSFIYERF